MKLLILTCLNFITTQLNYELYSQFKNDLAAENLKGRVKVITLKGDAKTMSSGSGFLYGFNDSKTTKKYSFDERGNISEITIFDKRGKNIVRYNHNYNDSGLKTGGFCYNNNDSIIYTYRFKYNNSKKSVLEEIYNKKDSLTGRHVYEYNSNGQIAAEYVYYPVDSLKQRIVYLYDKGLSSETHEYRTGVRTPLKYYHTYEDYDIEGNWQKRTVHVIQGRSVQYVYRAIEYYKP